MNYSTFNVDWQNRILDIFTGKVSNINTTDTYELENMSFNYYDSLGQPLGPNGMTLYSEYWQAVSNGEVPYQEPSGVRASQNAGTVSSVSGSLLVGSVFSGPCSLRGGDGAFIVDYLTVTDTLPGFKFVLKVPYNNSSSTNINQALSNDWASCIVHGLPVAIKMANGPISFYSGSQPSSANDPVPIGSTLLASQIIAASNWSPAFLASTSLINQTVEGSNVVSAGEATWGRWTYGGYAMDFSVGMSNADLIVDNRTISTGVSFNINSFPLFF